LIQSFADGSLRLTRKWCCRSLLGFIIESCFNLF
jgi:hypothetical protein